ncbi:MAG: PaaI family thioesterase [Spirochaetes bacterium]|nr:PaaI family thioesterase [Spirochaetota bacterium]
MECCKDHYITHDTFANALGIRVVKVTKDYAQCTIELNEKHYNGLGTVHGAVIFAIADITFAVACNTTKTSIGVHAEIKYLNKPQGNTVIAEATLISESKKIGHYCVSIYDDTGIHIAQFNSIAYRIANKS